MLQLSGLAMAVVTFLGIWWGHVGVRWIEAHSRSIVPPALLLIGAGFGLNIYSMFAPNLTLAGVSSIIGITLLWDAFELYRQQKRVKKGHAPANPNNPRHADYLARYPTATTEDLLDREPQGQPVASERSTSQPRRTTRERVAHGAD